MPPAPEQFDIAVDHRDGVVVVRPQGDLDIATTPLLDEILRDLAAKGASAVLDLGETEFIDSSGLQTILSAHAASQRDGFGLTMLPVVDGGFFRGVVTTTGCRRGGDEAPKVEQVMVQPALTVGPDFDVATLYEAMSRYEVVCVPVLDAGQVIGVVTRLDVLRALSHDDPHLRVSHAAEHG